MKTSAIGRARIEQREGRRLAAYRDARGILTIGVGHTGRMAPPPVTDAMTITDAECDALLAMDLGPVEHVLNTAVKVPMSQNEFDALASFGFNVGVVGLRTSTVLKRLNQGDVAGAADAFMMWDRPAILTGRRHAEAIQFLTPDPPGPGGVSRSATIAVARAATLTTRAETTKARGRLAQSGAATLVVASATIVATVPTHHSGLALVAGGLVLASAAGAALAAILNHRAAGVLAANAGGQGRNAGAPPVPFSKTLKP